MSALDEIEALLDEEAELQVALAEQQKRYLELRIQILDKQQAIAKVLLGET